MVNRPASPWSRAARTMRRHVDAAMNHMADAIKDALLDGLEPGDEDDAPVAPLTPLAQDEFVRRMRGPTDRALRQVADVLNAAPYASPSATDEATGDLFTELWLEALRVAAQMRLDADLAEQPPELPSPQGEWARRYRRMHADPH